MKIRNPIKIPIVRIGGTKRTAELTPPPDMKTRDETALPPLTAEDRREFMRALRGKAGTVPPQDTATQPENKP